jgi:hypothetical protein
LASSLPKAAAPDASPIFRSIERGPRVSEPIDGNELLKTERVAFSDRQGVVLTVRSTLVRTELKCCAADRLKSRGERIQIMGVHRPRPQLATNPA